MSPDSTAVPTDDLLEAARDPLRRALLRYLGECDRGAVSTDELIGGIRDASGGEATPDDPESLRVRLQHVHLPKLAQLGVIDYDPRTRTVRYRGDDRLERLLSAVETNQD